MRRIKFLLDLAHLSAWRIGWLIVFALLSSLLSTYPATYLGGLVDRLKALSFSSVAGGLALYAFLLIGGCAVRNLFCMACMNFSNRLIRNVRIACVEKFFRLDGRFFFTADRGSLTNLAFNLVNKLDLIFSTSFFMLLSDWLDVVFIAWFLLRKNALYLLIFLAGYPCLLLLIRLFNRVHARLARERLSVEKSLLARLAVIYANRSQILLYRRAKEETERLAADARALERNEYRGNCAISLYYVAKRIVCVAALVGSLLVTVAGISKGTATPGDVLVLVAFCDRFFSPLKNFSRYLQTLQRGLAAIDDLRAYFVRDERPAGALCVNGQEAFASSPGGELNLGETKLVYPPALFEKKGLYRVSGASGCGKTAWLKSLAGLVHAPQLLWSFARDPVGDVLFLEQEAPLMPGTVLENIRYGSDRQGALCEREKRVVDALGLDDLLDRDVGDCGDGLSTGQRQRVFLARALTSDVGMIICDETLSNLDPELRRDAGTLLAEESRRRCIVLITHLSDGLDPKRIKGEVKL